MQCLNKTQCSDWLRQHQVHEDPYFNEEAHELFCLQFEIPEKASRMSALTRHLFEAFGEFSGALLVFTDWPLYHPDEMAIIMGLRRAHGNQRLLIDAPGHLFGKAEKDEAIAHCYLSAMFGWRAYLYLPSGAVTLQIWKGDLLDVWTADEALEDAIRNIAIEFDLQITSDDDR